MEIIYDDHHLEDDCNLMHSSALSVIEIFTIKNREYFKLDPENIKNLRKIKRKEKEIDIIFDNIRKKYIFLEKIKACKNKSHSKLAFDLDHIFEDNKRMINSYNREKSAKSIITEKNINIDIGESSEDEFAVNKSTNLSRNNLKTFNENIQESNIKLAREKIKINGKEDQKIISNIYKNKIDNKYSNKNSTERNLICENEIIINNKIEKEKEIEQMEYIQANALGEIDIFTLEEILENSKEYKGDEEFRKNLINLKNQIQELSLCLENGIVQSNEKLDLISDDIKIADINVNDTNKNLKEAAIEKNKFNKIKYPLIFGGIGSSLGIVVPGVGSIIGGSIGSVLGYYLSKLEKKQIDKISSKEGKK
jgi:hypothetical protein